ncbi:MAG: S1C family serine protease [Acidimicrobiia bacterium]
MPLEDPGDDGPNGSPPDPLDRLWVHPSELSARSRPTPPSSRAPGRSRDWWLMLAAGATGALVATGALALTGLLGSGRSNLNPASPTPVAVLAARAAPAVVAVFAVGSTGERRGSGVVIADGWVLATCATIGDAGTATITGDDGSVHIATIRGLDPATDLALLRVDGLDELGGGLTPRTERPIEVGEAVIAVGSGDASRSWVATGVVSSTSTMATGGPTVRAGLIATDALTETGTSGGVLLDRDGHAVGVLTTGTDRAGVAVPIRTARDVADQLRKTGKAGHGWMGVSGGDALDRPGGGVRVTDVSSDSPASRAGIRPDDVIVAIDATRVTQMADLIAEVRALHPGDDTTLRVWRDGTTRTVPVTLHDMPAEVTPPSTSTTLLRAAAG